MGTAVDVSPAPGALPVRIVLVETTHPGNIGAAARAMKNMSLDRLWLVKPAVFPSADATARASGAADLLHQARVCDTLAEALTGCGYVIGSSARPRSLPWPLLTPRECGERVVAECATGEVALVFGREKSGLSNDELQQCHAVVQIPTNPDYSSLNLAMAVQVLTYEIMVARGADAGLRTRREAPLATADELELFYDHLQRVLIRTDFLDPDNPRHLMRRIRRLFARAEPDSNEIAILRGILSALAPGSGRPEGPDDPEETK